MHTRAFDEADTGQTLGSYRALGYNIDPAPALGMRLSTDD